MQTTEVNLNTVSNDNPKTASPPANQFKLWVNQNLISIMGGAAILSLSLFGVSLYNTAIAYRGFKNDITKQVQLQHLSDRIIYLDEVLTMSARMAASTGNLEWETRYYDHVDPLDDSIKAVVEDEPVYEEQVGATDEANQALINMEEQSFALVKENKAEEALQLLLSPEYQEQKEIYWDNITSVLEEIQVKTQKSLDAYRNRLFWSISFAGVSFPILLVSWLGVIGAVRFYIREQKRAEQELKNSEATLLGLNQDLEEKSQQIQETEQKTRQENEVLQDDIGHLLDVVSSLEDGDLRIQAEVNERVTGIVADTLNRLIEELGKVLATVLTTAQDVSIKANSLEEIAQQVATGADNQSQSVNNVLALSEKVQQSALTSSQEVEATNESLQTLQTTVEKATDAIAQLTEGMNVLSGGTEKIIQQMKTLGEFVGLADEFVGEQSEIAQQTQILALNASLVAARAAGQQNPNAWLQVAREFEDIAEQVSQLARSTSEGLATLEQRTKQIHTVVSTVDAEVQNLGGLVDDFQTGISQSNQLFTEVGTVTRQAFQAGQAVNESNQAIVKATEETVQAMGNIANLAQQTAQLSQNSLVQGELMRNLATKLLERIKFFQLPITETENKTTLEVEAKTVS